MNDNFLKKYFQLFKEAIKGAEYDYTQGDLRKAILLLAIPMILELSLESIFAIVDMFFVGHLDNSKTAIATVGLTEATMSLIYTLGIGLSTGATAVVARRIGEKNEKAAAHAGAQSILIALVLSVFITIGGILYAENILQLMGANDEVIHRGIGFTKIMFASSGIIILLFLINGIFRGAGDASMAMRSLWIASLINIILCPLLIYGVGPFPTLGLEGAAIGTVIGRTTGVIYQCYHLFKGDRVIQFSKSDFRFDFPVIKTISQVAFPATIQFFVQSGSWIFLAYLVSTFGSTEAIAGYQIAIRNVVFFILPAWGLSNAAATLVGQNLGAKNSERAEQSALLTLKYNAIFMGIVMLIFLFFSKYIILFYTRDPEVSKYGIAALQIIGSGYIFYGIGMVMIQALNGAGDSKTPTWINVFGFWVFQIPLAYILVHNSTLGVYGAMAAIPIAETIIALIAYYFFRQGKWKMVEV